MKLSDEQCHDLAVAFAQTYISSIFKIQGIDKEPASIDAFYNTYERAYNAYKEKKQRLKFLLEVGF